METLTLLALGRCRFGASSEGASAMRCNCGGGQPSKPQEAQGWWRRDSLLCRGERWMAPIVSFNCLCHISFYVKQCEEHMYVLTQSTIKS